MFQLYIDEDSGDRSLVQALRARGIDVITASEMGMIERTDDEHLRFATSQNRVLYSFNRGDFLRLHSQYLADGRDRAGILLARQQYYWWASRCVECSWSWPLRRLPTCATVWSS